VVRFVKDGARGCDRLIGRGRERGMRRGKRFDIADFSRTGEYDVRAEGKFILMYASSFLFLGDGIVFSVFGCVVVGSQQIATSLVENIGRGKPKQPASYLVYIDSRSSSRHDSGVGMTSEQRSA